MLEPTNLNIMLRVAYHSFIRFENSSMRFLPLWKIEDEKISIKKLACEKVILLHDLSE